MTRHPIYARVFESTRPLPGDPPILLGEVVRALTLTAAALAATFSGKTDPAQIAAVGAAMQEALLLRYTAALKETANG